jgi:Sulfotransferase family
MSTGLHHDELIEQASVATGLNDFGDLPLLEPLGVLVESMNREAQLIGPRLAQAASMIVTTLVKRLRLVDDRSRFPEIADEVIKAPLFIVGAPRTGSTHLHALLAQITDVRAPMFWEMTLPSPPPERATRLTDPRIAQIQAAVDQLPEELLKRHPIAPLRPEQCNVMMDWSFYNFAWLASYEIPTYRDWLFNADHAPALEAHRRTLQHLQWKYPGRWVLKYPKHLLNLDAVLDTYPDAGLIWTHRDPAVVIPSVCSLTGYMRSSSPGYDPARFGREWTAMEELVMRRGISVRDRRPGQPGRDLDIHYRDLMKDQVGTVTAICDHYGLSSSTESLAEVHAWIDNHPKTKHGVHEYTPEMFGLTTADLHRRFSFYTDRFGITTT